MQKRISLKGLADYMTSSPSKQRTILRQFKYPEEDDARARILYYRDARDRVVALHRSGHDADWLRQQASQLDALAAMSVGQTKVRLRHNARGLNSYANHFAGKPYEILSDIRLALKVGDVIISVVPDLHVRERTKEKLVKLEFSADEPSHQFIQIVSQSMFEATSQASLGLLSSHVLYVDAPRGVIHKGARVGSRMRRDIEAACLSISSIWEGL